MESVENASTSKQVPRKPLRFRQSNKFHYRLLGLALLLIFYSVKALLIHLPTDVELTIQDDDLDSFTVDRRLLGINPIRTRVSKDNCTPLAIENFPRDYFTQSQRRSGAVLFHIFMSAYMFLALAVVCDEYFIPCLEVISDALQIQPDVAGATFMAAGSSAPELATTLIGVFIARDDIGLGAIVGSADYNIMFVISICALFSKEVIYLNWYPMMRDTVFYLISIIALAAVIADEEVYWYEALILLIIYAIYIVWMYFNRKIDSKANAWCLSHRNICPRLLHTDEVESANQQNRGGKFGHRGVPEKADEDFGIIESHGGQQLPVVNYSRLDDDEDGSNMMPVIKEVPSGDAKTRIEDEVKTVPDYSHPTDDDHLRSWSQACLAPLLFPPRGSSVWRWTYFLIAWPIRFLLCLTTPDCRLPRWRRLHGHWIAFIMSCVWIGIYTIIMMWMITIIGLTLGIPDTILGLTFIAAGSSVPDAITSVIVVREGEGDMAISNAVGSNVFDILICMGLPWLLRCIAIKGPVEIYSKGLTYATLTLLTNVVILIGATHLNRWRLTKMYGIGLMLAYIGFLILCSLYELNYFGMVHPIDCIFREDL